MANMVAENEEKMRRAVAESVTEAKEWWIEQLSIIKAQMEG